MRSNSPRALVLSGSIGRGIAPLDSAAAELAAHGYHVLAVAGSNAELLAQLQAVAEAQPSVHPFGYVDNLHELMSASDVVVSGAGQTCHEVRVVGRPLVLLDVVPGHGRENLLYELTLGGALACSPGPELVLAAVDATLKSHPAIDPWPIRSASEWNTRFLRLLGPLGTSRWAEPVARRIDRSGAGVGHTGAVRRGVFSLVIGGTLLACVACGSPAVTRSSPPPPSGPAVTSRVAKPVRFSHVFVVVMENLSYTSALGTPGFAALAHRYAYDTHSYAAAHPSLPNYLALTAGSTFGIRSDCLTCYVSAPNLGAELSKARVSWDAYFQSLPSSCYLGTSYGSYAAKHNPFRYYADIRSSPSLCSHLLPYAELPVVLRGPATRVPRFVWVTPNICDDGHSCAPRTAAEWLARFVALVTASAAWQHGGLLLVTWDEGSYGDTSTISPSGRNMTTGGGGHILTLLLTPDLRPGRVLSAPLTPYGILATIEENFGLPLLDSARSWGAHTLLGVPGLGEP